MESSGLNPVQSERLQNLTKKDVSQISKGKTLSKTFLEKAAKKPEANKTASEHVKTKMSLLKKLAITVSLVLATAAVIGGCIAAAILFPPCLPAAIAIGIVVGLPMAGATAMMMGDIWSKDACDHFDITQDDKEIYDKLLQMEKEAKDAQALAKQQKGHNKVFPEQQTNELEESYQQGVQKSQEFEILDLDSQEYKEN